MQKSFATPESIVSLLVALDDAVPEVLIEWVQNHEPNAPIIGEWSLMHLVATRNSVKACKILLEAGVSPSPSSLAPRTPLMLASELGYTEVARLLIQYGAPLDEVSWDGFTALALASGSSLGLVAPLIDAGANLNFTDEIGYTPLVRACLWNPSAIEPLLLAGADPNYPTKLGTTMTLVADLGSYNSIVKVFEAGADPDGRSASGKSLLYILARDGRLDLCQELVAQGINPGCESHRFEGKLPHEVATGQTRAFLAKVVQTWQYRERLTEIARQMDVDLEKENPLPFM